MFPKIQNVVSTSNLQCLLDLQELSRKVYNIEYNRHKWAPAAIMRLKKPRTTALVFGSGKLVCSGAKSPDDSKTAARRFARIIQKAGFEVKFSEFKIQNIVSSYEFDFRVNLEELYTQNRELCTFDPTSFPGLTYRCQSSGVTLLVFTSGKIVLTNIHSISDMIKYFNEIFPMLAKYKKQQQ